MKTDLKSSSIGVCILAYSRVKHLKKTIKKLLQFIGKKDKIYIFCDNAPDQIDKIKSKEIQQVKLYLSNLDKNKFKVFIRKKNIGIKKNWSLANDYMFSKFRKSICLEDDILIKKDFLPFMKFYLNKYEKNDKVMNITGFGTDINLPKNYKYDCFLSRRSMSWGQGTWKNSWQKYKMINKDHLKILKNKNKKKLLISAGQDNLRTLILDYFNLSDSIQVWWIWTLVYNNGLSINPTRSLVNNIGFDGSGFHTKKNHFIPKIKLGNIRKSRMLKLIYLKSLDEIFIQQFKIKKLTYFLLNYLPLELNKFLFKLKKYLLN